MLRDFLQQWRNIGASPHVVQWLQQGVTIPFQTIPPVFEFKNYVHSLKEFTFLCQEIKRLESLGVISCVSTKSKGISPITCVPKKGKNQFRKIIDLRHLNSFCSVDTFRNEDIEVVCGMVQAKDEMVTVDLRDGFQHIGIHPDFRTYLGFTWQNRWYVYNVLPFGACFSPFYFCKTVREVLRHCRETLSLRLSCWVDDFILVSGCMENDKPVFLNCLQSLGWNINWEKSSLTPSTTKDYIGYQIKSDTPENVPIISVTHQRICKLTRDLSRILKNTTVSARVLARIAGQCISMSRVILPAKLLLRNIYRLLRTKDTWNSQLVIDQPARNDLIYWKDSLTAWNGRLVTARQTDVQAVSDASQSGWGFACLGLEAAGHWDKYMALQPSNVREMMAVLLGLETFREELRNKNVQILSDNISTVANINFQGGPSDTLTHIARAIWNVAISNNIHIQARYLRGKDNTLADGLSRLQDNQGWMLNPQLFRFLDATWGPHTIDRFADFRNKQVATYNSRYRDPQSVGVDALSQRDWSAHNNWVCPPFRLIGQILDLLQTQKATATIIAPWWPAQPFLQRLKQMSVDQPIPLPPMQKCIHFHGLNPEPLKNPKWRLYAWRVCGKPD
jgi:ribonuclease HI